MKRMNILKVVTCSLALTALMTITAFAATGQPTNLEKEPTPVAVTQQQGDAVKEDAAKNMLVSGKVTEVTKDKDTYTIHIDNSEMGMVFHVKDAFVYDQGAKKFVGLDDIKKGMEIAAVLNKMAPMTLSLPPQTSEAIGFVIKSEDGFVDLSVYDDDLVNADHSLMLNNVDKVQITDVKGSKKTFTAEDLKGSECLVLYGASTKSIPAQTTPDFVMILNTKAELAENANNDGANDNATTTPEAPADKYVELRSAAEAKGYTIKWESAKKPIVLTKDDMTIELMIGNQDFKFTHTTKDIKPLDAMKKLNLAVKLENSKTMVPNSFIEALQ